MKIDKSKFKGKDLGALREITDYLENYGLNVEVRGSASKGDRNYHDIDLFVSGNFSAKGTAVENLEMRRRQDDLNTPKLDTEEFLEEQFFPKYSESGERYSVRNLGSAITRYVGACVDYKFEIRRSDTKTPFEVSFERNKEILD